MEVKFIISNPEYLDRSKTRIAEFQNFSISVDRHLTRCDSG